jgi:hypothetical protein
LISLKKELVYYKKEVDYMNEQLKIEEIVHNESVRLKDKINMRFKQERQFFMDIMQITLDILKELPYEKANIYAEQIIKVLDDYESKK